MIGAFIRRIYLYGIYFYGIYLYGTYLSSCEQSVELLKLESTKPVICKY